MKRRRVLSRFLMLQDEHTNIRLAWRDKMKGRPAYMMETVKRDCTAKFCTEVPVPPITEERKAALTAAAKKIADKCKSDAEAFPNYYTRLDAGLCRRPSPTARRPVSFAIKRPP